MSLSEQQVMEHVREVLAAIAPEVDLAALDPTAPMREELDLDSMDFLRFITGLHAELGVEVPEADYRKLGTLDGCVAYLEAHAPAAGTR